MNEEDETNHAVDHDGQDAGAGLGAVGREAVARGPSPRRRLGTPVVKPKGMPAPRRRLTAADVPGVGGMVEKVWSGLRMFECPKCLGTTFVEQEAKVHVCKKIKYAGEEELPE